MALPYLLGGGAWAIYILGDPAEFRSQFQVSLGMGRTSGFRNPLLGVKREIIERFLAYYGLRADATALILLKMILPVGYLLGLAGVFLVPAARRNRFVRLATLLLIVQFLILAVAEGTKQFHYIVHVIPTMDMILGGVIWLGWEERWIPRPLCAAGLAGLLVLQIGPTLFRVLEDRYRKDFVPVVHYIEPYVARGELVIGQTEFAIPLGFPNNLIADSTYGWKRQPRPVLMVVDETVLKSNANGVRERRPDIYHYLTQEFPLEYGSVFSRGNYTVYRRR